MDPTLLSQSGGFFSAMIDMLCKAAANVIMAAFMLGSVYARLFDALPVLPKERNASEARGSFRDSKAQSSALHTEASINALCIIDEAKTPVQACAASTPFYSNYDLDAMAEPRTPADQIPFDARGATPGAPFPVQTVARTVPAPPTSEPPSPYSTNIVRNLEPVLMAVATATSTTALNDDVCVEVCTGASVDAGGEVYERYGEEPSIWVNGLINESDSSRLLQGSPGELLQDDILTPLPVSTPLPISTPLPVSTPPWAAVPQDTVLPQLISTPQPKTTTTVFPESKSKCLQEGLAASPIWVAQTVLRKAPSDIADERASSALMLTPVTLATPPAIESGGIDAVNSVKAAGAWREDAFHICDTPIAFPTATAAVEVVAREDSSHDVPTLGKLGLPHRLQLHTCVQEERRVDEAEDCAAVDAHDLLSSNVLQSMTMVASGGCHSGFGVPTVELPAAPNSPGPDDMGTGNAKELTPSGSPLFVLSQGMEEEDAEYRDDEAPKFVEAASAAAALRDPSFAIESVAQHEQDREQPHSPPVAVGFPSISEPSPQNLLQSTSKSGTTVTANPARVPAGVNRRARAAKGRSTPSPIHKPHSRARQPGDASAGKGATAAATATAAPRMVASNPKLKRAIISSPTGSAGNATPATARRPVGPDPAEGVRSPRSGGGAKRPVVRRLNTTSPRIDAVNATAKFATISVGDSNAASSMEAGLHSDSGVMPRYAAPTVASIARQATISPPQLQQQLRFASSSKLSLTTVMAHIGVESVRGAGTAAAIDGSSRRSTLESKLQASVASTALIP